MSISSLILFLLTVLLAFTMQAMTGFGGPLLAMPVCILLSDMDSAKSVLCMLAWLTGIAVVLPRWRDVNRKELLKITAVMAIGMVLGACLYDIMPKETLLPIFGVVVILVALRNLFAKKELVFPHWARLCSLVLAGLMQGLFLSGGSFLIIYAQQTFHDKNEFRATGSAVWAILNTYMVFKTWRSGMYTQARLPLLILALAVSFAAVALGSVLQKKVEHGTFMKITNWLLLAAGIILLAN